MDLNKVKNFSAYYSFHGKNSFLDWLNANLQKAKNISDNKSFKTYLTLPDNETFYCIFDSYHGMPYRFSIGNEFGTAKTGFVIDVGYEEK